MEWIPISMEWIPKRRQGVSPAPHQNGFVLRCFPGRGVHRRFSVGTQFERRALPPQWSSDGQAFCPAGFRSRCSALPRELSPRGRIRGGRRRFLTVSKGPALLCFPGPGLTPDRVSGTRRVQVPPFAFLLSLSLRLRKAQAEAEVGTGPAVVGHGRRRRARRVRPDIATGRTPASRSRSRLGARHNGDAAAGGGAPKSASPRRAAKSVLTGRFLALKVR